ncbi:MAG: non-canonical purine NTP pyrophosphatase [Clostridiales bacterium]|jgi:XTP/dITP diphosphohydrolase|nr:non-canonical purine NTP pyrophosphatase [Clostridiales bacterium]
MEIVVATRNADKIREIRAILPGGFKLLSLDDIGFDLDLEAAEDGESFEENVIKKAEFVRSFLAYDCLVLADDSGLVIDALGGLPGVDSANFMGRDTPYKVRHEWILAQIGALGRSARFVCVMALATPAGTRTFHATMEGKIAEKPAGDGGFGYDPIFYLPEFGKTAAQLSMEQKNKISHRGKALLKAVDYLHENFGI